MSDTRTESDALGEMALNPFLPVIADRLLESIGLLTRACRMLARHCVRGVEVDEACCRRHVDTATAAVTALVGAIGYERAGEIAASVRRDGSTIREAAVASGLLTGEQFDELVSPEAVMRLGTSFADGDDTGRGA